MTFLGYDRLRPLEFLGLSTFQFLAYFRRSLFYGFVAVYLGKELGLSTFDVTLMATFGMVANAGTQTFIWGPLLDRVRRSALFVFVGEIVAGFGHIALYLWHLTALNSGDLRYAGFTIIVGLAVIEIFWSQSNVGWSALISELTLVHQRKKLMSQLSIIGGFGGISGATLAGYLYLSGEGFANGNLFYIPAGIMIVSALFVYSSIRDKDERLPLDGEDGMPKGEKPAVADIPSEVRKLFTLFMVALVFINFGRNSIALIASLYIVDAGSFAATDMQLALYRNVSSASTMLFGFLLGSVFAMTSDSKVMTTGIIFALAGLTWLIFAPTFALVLIGSALIGATQVIIQASSYGIVASIVPEEYRGRLFAVYNATFFLSWGIAGTFIAAPIADYYIERGFGSAFGYQMSFVSAIVMVLVGFLIYLGFLRRFREHDPLSSRS